MPLRVELPTSGRTVLQEDDGHIPGVAELDKLRCFVCLGREEYRVVGDDAHGEAMDVGPAKNPEAL